MCEMYSYEQLNFYGWIVVWRLMNKFDPLDDMVPNKLMWSKTYGVILTNEIDSTENIYINASDPIWWIYEDEAM